MGLLLKTARVFPLPQKALPYLKTWHWNLTAQSNDVLMHVDSGEYSILVLAINALASNINKIIDFKIVVIAFNVFHDLAMCVQHCG